MKALWWNIAEWIKSGGIDVLVPFYHGVSPDPAMFSEGLYPHKTPAAFEREVEYLVRRFRPVDIEELIGFIRRGERPDKPLVHLTFDDGLRSVFEYALPVLKAKGIPATVFVNTAFIDNRDMFYRYKAVLLQKHLEAHPGLTWEDDAEGVAEAGGLTEYISRIEYDNRHLLDEIATATGFDFKAFLDREKPYLSSEQIRTWLSEGFGLGSHSIDHPYFAGLDEEEQLRQVNVSLDYLSEHFGIPYRAFAFPFEDLGVSRNFFDRMKVDISFGTAGLKTDPIPNHLQRMDWERCPGNPGSYLLAGYLKYLLKIPLSKHRIYRN